MRRTNVMKKLFLSVLFLLGCVSGSAQTPDFSLVGFAAEKTAGFTNGTTGGGNAVPVTVTTYEELKAQFLIAGKVNKNPKVIYVQGKIEVPGGGDPIEVSSNTTLYGLGADAFISQINLYLKNASNVIIRNIKFSAVGSTRGSESDCISIATTSSGVCSHIWIDHCEFFNVTPIRNPSASLKDLYDGLLDIKKTSEYITVSWCHFHDHYKAILVGYTDTDVYDRKITMHHNIFERVNSRAPSYRGGTGHIYNNYYIATQDGTGYFGDGINTREEATLLAENNYFLNMNNGIYCALDDVVKEGFATGSGNIFNGGKASFTANPGTPFVAPYSVKQDTANVLPALLPTWAGIGKITGENDYGTVDTSSGINSPKAIKTLASTNYYSLSGMKIVIPNKKGIYLKESTYLDGSKETTKLAY